ncbi:MAG: peptidoglycan DD-metalloendopeptidase family protein [Minisyncoccota bacterium]
MLEQFALLITGCAVVALSIALLPNRANAFWPFSTNADAAVNTFIPSASTPVLVAAVNSDPNIGAPLAFATSDGSALVSYSGPSGTIADIAKVAPPDRISVYVVRPGDTLSGIAALFGVSVNTIVWANNLKNVQDVHPGDTLIILPVSGVEHTVVKGDTFKSIAKKYNADATEIAQFNGLDPTAPLALGTKIIIPGGEIAMPAISRTRAGGGIRFSSGRVIYEPYLGGSGPAQPGYYDNPLPGGVITQSIHGWNAVDIGAARGTPIHAAANGTVIVARNNGSWNGGYGNYVVITHDNNTETLYAHMTHAIVSPGQAVLGGQIIGYVGMTGMATGPHLHFEVRGAKNPFAQCPVGSRCSPQ